MATKYKSKGISLTPYLVGIGIPLAFFSIYIGYRVYSTDKVLIPISVIAIFLGVIFESWRINSNWKKVLGIALISFISSFFSFLPGKHEMSYSLESHIEIWPYFFLFMFLLIEIAFSRDKIIQELTVGITLMQSMAVLYWAVDLGFNFNSNIFIKIPLVIGVCFALYSIFAAFQNQTLSVRSRLALSIWSSFIMVLFAIDNTYQVFQYIHIERSQDTITFIYILFSFFILGISSVFMLQNIMMLLGFLPGKGSFFNEEYFKELKKLKQEHISRYSIEPVSRISAFLCIFSTGTIFSLNYFYHFLPRNFLIWIVFILFPIVISFIIRGNKKQAHANIVSTDK